MTDGELLALTRVWWTWASVDVRKAVDAPIRERWLKIARRQPGVGVPDRRQAHEHAEKTFRNLLPGLQALFCVSQYGSGHLQRMQNGVGAASPPFLLGLATALRVNIRDFYPETTLEWVAEATHYLCTREDEHGQETVSCREVRAYATFMLDDPPEHRVHTSDSVDWRLTRLRADSRAAVRTVARILGPILLPIDPVLTAESRQGGAVHNHK
jgi:hypothetical protein